LNKKQSLGKHGIIINTSFNPNVFQVDTPSAATTATAAPSAERVATSSLLLEFITENKDCLKCSAGEYYKWLQSEDVDTLHDFADAIQDDDFATKMKLHGIKVMFFLSLKFDCSFYLFKNKTN
jgi:hypothetical protein